MYVSQPWVCYHSPITGNIQTLGALEYTHKRWYAIYGFYKNEGHDIGMINEAGAKTHNIVTATMNQDQTASLRG